ncbi:MAG: HAMP domain-containing histidine kinase [Bacteroidales bacterium]|nr:HAMP domain-containing histidine kinase [Bacteroidales bacterium]
MAKLKLKLALFNMLTKIAVSLLFMIFLPYLVERINLRQTDNDLIRKREQVIDMIIAVGLDPFLSVDSTDAFGSYNILKEEFISIERLDSVGDQNYIEVATRLIEDEEIDYRVLHYAITVDGEPYLLEVGKSIESIIQVRRNITNILILFIILVIIITLAADLQYTNILLVPLDKITAKLKNVDEPSLFDKTPVPTSTTDFTGLDDALTELMSKTDELFRREKEITVNISHELLTPVSIMRSKLENLILRKDIDPEVASRIEESLKTLHRLQSLVNSMLMIARIESRQYLRNDSFSIAGLLREIISEVSPVAEDKGVKVESTLDDDLVFGSANRILIFSMFYNVIYNGVKNTPPGGEVNIVMGTREGRYTVAVADTGPGLSENQIANLFSRFRSRQESDNEGNGIGLAIARAIADFHEIEISVISNPGSGAHFLFILPEIS